MLQEAIQNIKAQEDIFGNMHNNNNVNHPSYYTKNGRKECIVEMEEKYGAEATAIFCLTNAYKYLYRAGEKFGNPANQDVAKAQWYYDYANKLIAKYGMIAFNGIRIEDTDLYLYIRDNLDVFGLPFVTVE